MTSLERVRGILQGFKGTILEYEGSMQDINNPHVKLPVSRVTQIMGELEAIEKDLEMHTPWGNIDNMTLLQLSVNVKMENITPEQLGALRILTRDVMEGTRSFIDKPNEPR